MTVLPSGMLAARHVFREYALDGAQLFFHPASGTHVRVQTRATAGLRRVAPRAVMFGITNACNLRCDFCSRDVARESLWSVESAYALLAGLARAGTLEVAFGGGEPFAFRGFAELVDALHRETPLAIHVTTNGTLLDARRWQAFAGRFGIVRLSLYQGTPWHETAALLRDAGQRFGANVLVDDAALARLPARLETLARHGCEDVSLLSFVGVARGLTPAGRRRVARIIATSPLPVRLSVCFGDRIPVARLFAGMDDDGDCGAGFDFVSITPDRRMQSCSFQQASVPARSADEVLHAWRAHRRLWRAPAPRSGCARREDGADENPPLVALRTHAAAPANTFMRRETPSRGGFPPVAVWRSFAGNNSGECTLVAKFGTPADAERYLADLLPSWDGGDGPYPAPWRALFEAEGVAGPHAHADYDRGAPEEFTAIGATIVARGTAAEDAFPELRALAWKRGAYVVPGGIHEHASPWMLAAIRGRDAEDVRTVVRRAEALGVRAYPHGDRLLLRLDPLGRERAPSFEAVKDALQRLAESRPFAFEASYPGEGDDTALVAAKQRWDVPFATEPRLWVTFWSLDRTEAETQATAFARSLGAQPLTRCGPYVLIERPQGRKRLAVLAYRRDGTVTALDHAEVEVGCTLWDPHAYGRKGKTSTLPERDFDAFQARVRDRVNHAEGLTIKRNGGSFARSITIRGRSRVPAAALRELWEVTETLACDRSLWVRDPDPVHAALRRLLDDLARRSAERG